MSETPSTKITDRTPIYFGFFGVAMCAILICDQINCWLAKDDYLFGFLVPLFCAFVIKERWRKIRRLFTGTMNEEDAGDEFQLPQCVRAGVLVPTGLSAIFAAGTLVSLVLFAVGAIGSAIYGFYASTTHQNTMGFIGLAFGVAWFASSKDLHGKTLDLRTRGRLLMLLVFPICVWFVSGPFTFLVDRQIKGFLLANVTAAVVALLNLLGFDLTQAGNTIVLPGGDIVGVEDACSGVRSLTSCVFTGTFLAAVFLHSVKKKVFFVALSVFFALFLNVMRSSFLTLWSAFNGSKTLEYDIFGNAVDSTNFTFGTVHDVAGWGAMVITLALMVALIPLINLKREKTDEEMGLTFVDEDEKLH